MQKSNVERRRRMGFIQKFLEQHKFVEMDKLVGQMMMNFGVSKRNAREEIEGVCQALGFVKSGNLIKSQEKENATTTETQKREREISE